MRVLGTPCTDYKAHEHGGLTSIQGYAVRKAQRAVMSAGQMLAAADMQAEGIVAILHSHVTPCFFGKGFQEYLTVHASIHYRYLLPGDAPRSPDMTGLRAQTLGFGHNDLFQQHENMVYLQTHHTSWLRSLGPDKFLNHWRQRAEAQASSLLSPIHLLSGLTPDYYAVILIGTDYAPVPVFMSYRTDSVCHIVHAPPGTNDTATGMPLQDVYLPLEFHCFMRHVRMLRPANTERTDYRDLLPQPVGHRLKRTAEHEPSTNPPPSRRLASSAVLALAALQPHIEPQTMGRGPSTPIHFTRSEVPAKARSEVPAKAPLVLEEIRLQDGIGGSLCTFSPGLDVWFGNSLHTFNISLKSSVSDLLKVIAERFPPPAALSRLVLRVREFEYHALNTCSLWSTGCGRGSPLVVPVALYLHEDPLGILAQDEVSGPTTVTSEVPPTVASAPSLTHLCCPLAFVFNAHGLCSSESLLEAGVQVRAAQLHELGGASAGHGMKMRHQCSMVLNMGAGSAVIYPDLYAIVIIGALRTDRISLVIMEGKHHQRSWFEANGLPGRLIGIRELKTVVHTLQLKVISSKSLQLTPSDDVGTQPPGDHQFTVPTGTAELRAHLSYSAEPRLPSPVDSPSDASLHTDAEYEGELHWLKTSLRGCLKFLDLGPLLDLAEREVDGGCSSDEALEGCDGALSMATTQETGWQQLHQMTGGDHSTTTRSSYHSEFDGFFTWTPMPLGPVRDRLDTVQLLAWSERDLGSDSCEHCPT